MLVNILRQLEQLRLVLLLFLTHLFVQEGHVSCLTTLTLNLVLLLLFYHLFELFDVLAKTAQIVSILTFSCLEQVDALVLDLLLYRAYLLTCHRLYYEQDLAEADSLL